MREFVDHHKRSGWDGKISIPPVLHQEVLSLKDTMLSWKGRVMEGVVPVRKLYSDASNFGWAGVDVSTGKCVQEFWRGNDGLHINVRELHAAIASVKSLAKEGEKVHLIVDNSVAASYPRKTGGRKAY